MKSISLTLGSAKLSLTLINSVLAANQGLVINGDRVLDPETQYEVRRP